MGASAVRACSMDTWVTLTNPHVGAVAQAPPAKGDDDDDLGDAGGTAIGAEASLAVSLHSPPGQPRELDGDRAASDFSPNTRPGTLGMCSM